MLAWNNRLAIDDYYFLFKFNEMGIWQSVVHDYQTWSTRWSSNLLTHLVLWLDQLTGKGLFLFAILNLSVFVLSIFLFIRSLFEWLPFLKSISRTDLMNLSFFLVSVFFISTIRIGETWFWLCASCTYLWANMMFVFGGSWILQRNNSMLYYVGGIIAFAYIGGSSEPLAIITLFLLLMSIAYLIVKKGNASIWQRALLSRMMLGFLICLVSFVVLYLGPGIRIREGFFDKVDLLTMMALHIKMTGIIFIKRLIWMIPYLLLMGIIGFYLGHQFKKDQWLVGWKKVLILLTLGYFLSIFIYQFPISYITHDTAASRALMIVNILTGLYILACSFILGQHTQLPNKVMTKIAGFGLLISIGIFGFYGWKELNTAFFYSHSVDDRMRYIQEIKGEGVIIEVEPLMPSGMLYSAEMSTDTSNFANYHLKKALYLNQPIKLKD